jgi:hypothetical protein
MALFYCRRETITLPWSRGGPQQRRCSRDRQRVVQESPVNRSFAGAAADGLWLC